VHTTVYALNFIGIFINAPQPREHVLDMHTIVYALNFIGIFLTAPQPREPYVLYVHTTVYALSS
jgi:hypothetical protein